MNRFGYVNPKLSAVFIHATKIIQLIKNFNTGFLILLCDSRLNKAHKARVACVPKILPSRPINQNLIRENWDDILNFMTTIKLKETNASILFKRLSSYAKDHPLYKAIKEFGRIIKSQYILTYIDDCALRQRIEKQLNSVELSNKFSKAVFFEHNQEFSVAMKGEQEIAAGCKSLIQNSIVLWNYLFLSQRIVNTKKAKDKATLLSIVKNGSMQSWAHVNMRGEYDFTKAANNAYFDMSKILSLKLKESSG